MDRKRTANLLGALVLALADELAQTTTEHAGHTAAAPAALVTIGTDPGQTIDQLSTVLRLSHSGTVRLIDRLAQDDLVERRAATDGRAVALHLTARGAQQTAALLAGRQRLLERAVQGLALDQQAQLTGLLEAMLTALVTSRNQADTVCRLCDEVVCPAATCPAEQAGLRAVSEK